MKIRLLQAVLLLVAVSAGALACGGSDTAPNGMKADDILAMCHNASASINTSQLYTTVTLTHSTTNSFTTIDAFTSRDRLNHTSFRSENTSMTYDSYIYLSSKEIYIFNNSLYVYNSYEAGTINKSNWIRTQSTVDLWDEASTNNLYQESINRPTDADYMGTERVGGIDCYKIGFEHDLVAVADILRYFHYNASGLDSGLSSGNISNLECDIYIDENTYYPVQTSFTYNLILDNYITTVSDIGILSSINQPVNIILPEEAINATAISYSDYVSGDY